MNDGQVEVPAKARERKGVQPVVTLTANGGARAELAVGTPVEFTGMVEVPPGTGKVVDAEWDFEGSGEFPVKGQVSLDESGERATVKTTYSFSKPGTYFAVLRAASQAQAGRHALCEGSEHRQGPSGSQSLTASGMPRAHPCSWCCDFDPSRIKTFDARFLSPVYPGETIIIRMWKDGAMVLFECSVAERSVTVIKNGRSDHAE